MIKEFKISTSKTARYYSLGILSRDTKNIWFVFHGYGQLAKDFLSEFEVISDKRNLFVAVEALNRFYFKGFSGKVGASWMTKEARNDEIEDYIVLISSIFKKIIGEIDRTQLKINVLGFSQGTHTAVRWINSSKIPVENLILWSGAFPHDVDYAESSDYWSNVKTKIVLGSKDKMIDQETFIKELEFLKINNLDIELINFHGGHQIDGKLLIQLNKKLNN
jgi:predicted esterase